MQPNFTRDAVYHAERLPAFVGHQPQWRFQAHAQPFSLINAWWLCNLSHLVYYDEADTLPVLQRVGLNLEAFIDDRHEPDSQGKLIKDTQALIVSNEEAVMLVFRGTEPDVYQDVLADAYLTPTEFPGGGQVHSGFYKALSGACWARIQAVLQRPALKDKPLWISGHSLGAALAMVAGAQLNPAGIYNFGSPRVGDGAFCDRFNALNLQRFVNCSDLVTQVPVQDVLGFQHGGIVRYFDASGGLHSQPDPAFVRQDQTRARWLYPFQQWPLPFLNDKLLLRSLADHSIVNYAYGIWKNLKQLGE